MLKFIKKFGPFIPALFLTLLVGHASAASIKSTVTVYSNIVTVKDLFENADKLANEPLFLSPDIGKSGTISAQRVANEAYNIGLYNIELNNIETVTVHRPSQKINRDRLQAELRDIVTKKLSTKIDFELTTNSLPKLVHADARISDAVKVRDFRLFENEKRFEAIFEISSYNRPTNIPVRGAIIEMTKVITPTRALQRDEVIGAGDVEEKRVPLARVRPGTLSSLEAFIGKAATRNLAQGNALREKDVTEPILVRSNDSVSILYSIPGLILTSQGRALDPGAKDDIISVMNLQSRRIIRGRVTNRGEVIVDVKKPLFANTQIPSQNPQEVR